MSADQLPPWVAFVVAGLALAGSALSLIGAIGLAQLKTFYERVHAPTLGATLGMARTGTIGQHESGDLFIAFSTVPLNAAASLPDTQLSEIFGLVVDAVEEAILNALCAAESMVGFRGRSAEAIDVGLVARVASGQVKEVILALNATVDGQTTAHYVTDLLAPYGVLVTRLAHGVPVGGELDYLDDGTLHAAIRQRTSV